MDFYYGGNPITDEVKPPVSFGRGMLGYPSNVPSDRDPDYALRHQGPVLPQQNCIDWQECDEVRQDPLQWTGIADVSAGLFSHSPVSDHSTNTVSLNGSSGNTDGPSKGASNNVTIPDDDPEAIERKRKAQNRAAQRAFRERKEQRVKELEQRLQDAENEVKRLLAENEMLKRENTILMTENQVLISTQRSNAKTQQNQQDQAVKSLPNRVSFPGDFYTSLLSGHDTNDKEYPSYAIYEKQEGETMLGAGAVWQRIVEDPQHAMDDVDIQFVLDYLLDKAHCDGFGPVFSLRDVNEGIRLALLERQQRANRQ